MLEEAVFAEREQRRYELDKELEQFKADLAERARRYDEELIRERLEDQNHHARILIEHRGVFDFALLAVRTLLITNGGAVLSLLTFVGNVLVRKGDAGAQVFDPGMLSDAMLWYIGGVCAALVTAMGAYLAQVAFVELEQGHLSPAVLIGNTVRVAAVVSAIASLGAFVVGSAICANAFSGVSAG